MAEWVDDSQLNAESRRRSAACFLLVAYCCDASRRAIIRTAFFFDNLRMSAYNEPISHV
jgi:hypothetical protein